MWLWAIVRMNGLFEDAANRTKQGDLGEAKAIYELTRLGYDVSRTLFDSSKYDLVVDNGTLYRVQVKTTRHMRDGKYLVQLQTAGGNRKINTIRRRQDSDYDFLFVVADNEDCWFIPTDALTSRTQVTLGELYTKFKLG